MDHPSSSSPRALRAVVYAGTIWMLFLWQQDKWPPVKPFQSRTGGMVVIWRVRKITKEMIANEEGNLENVGTVSGPGCRAN
ncbi:hypothetical protein DAPPUDRAFT_236826 [Daphnia pulex]|uniref:Uncharacterized protein n=1 Tax=Daphnia pulex TaxID=6669 RepID=E9G210_DAPPU|nr:hypothetical protein DAPPUDRAFT_236826 [Daphnia pulex]|eukprot:EFX86166.1 hypothetical protein DAPPUDRAFT_236826 [Daphnia pulex]